jgi:hypothetical protein
MKRFSLISAIVVLCMAFATAHAQDKFKPFVLGSVSSGDFDRKINETKAALTQQGFSIVGEYTPYANAHVIAVTSDELKRIAAQTERGGYAVAQRVSVTKVGDNIQVSYANPLYIEHAYQLGASMAPVAQKLEAALGKQEEFGAKGQSAKDLRKYHYTFGMEYFDDVYKLASYGSHAEAVAAVEKGLAAGEQGVTQIYRVDIPGKQVTVFGVAMKAPANGDQNMDDKFQMEIVDFQELKGTAYLPYEIMVKDNEVEALHMRFRMAVHFPDLKMMGQNSFMKLMKSPDAIHKALTETVGGKYETKGAW